MGQRCVQLHLQIFCLGSSRPWRVGGEGDAMWQAPACSEGRGGSLMVMTCHTRCVVTVLARRFEPPRGVGALTCANRVDMAPRLPELIALSLLAGLGCGLALGRGDLIFVTVFGAACTMAIIGAMQRFP